MKRYIKSSHSRWESELENQLYQAWENYKNDSSLTEKDIEDIVVEHLNYLIDEGSIDDAPDAWEAEARGYVKDNIDKYSFQNPLVDDAPRKRKKSAKQSELSDYDRYKQEVDNLKKRLKYSNKRGSATATISSYLDPDGYSRVYVTTQGQSLSGAEARALAAALNNIADELDEFNADHKYNVSPF